PCVSARLRPRPAATLFPYTTLFRSVQASGAGERRALLGEPDHRVDGLIVDVDLEVQVCAGGETEVSHAGDRLPGHHTVTHGHVRSEEHTSELQSRFDLVCRLLLEEK